MVFAYQILTGIKIGLAEFTKVLSDDGWFSNDSSIIQLQSFKIRFKTSFQKMEPLNQLTWNLFLGIYSSVPLLVMFTTEQIDSLNFNV